MTEQVQPGQLGLDGKIVLVTGGVRGVGAGIAAVLAGLGATPVVCARRGPDSSSAERAPGEFVACDVRDPEQVGELVAGIVDRHGRLDGVVNNAGGSPFALTADASDSFAAKIVALNLLAPLTVARAAHAVMTGQPGGGAIVNVSSVSGHRPSPGTAAYGAAKAGLDNLTGSLAVEWAPQVRINSVIAGPVQTESSHLHYGDEAGVAAVGATIPMGRLARPSDIGHAVAFLLSPLAAYITGSTLTVHGGGEKPAFLDAANAGNDVQQVQTQKSETS
ncbi:putative oxidoreductase [Gordonia hirsuta DSM 44140 = NBRC 16056]|uniref:Putative oxidoreductase n=1 Tax=Gordonia hirsuta DSM 44140 = NBRC 16056 TaxID=1121927 RepID=L7LCZ2_9ACTN|nr:SDR family oxidoreductase [Gordonia hirsuta]GAC57913.1 putative oxidoreductase [Gordonia hirsuta DSM 44140 = NBRC 16056]